MLLRWNRLIRASPPQIETIVRITWAHIVVALVIALAALTFVRLRNAGGTALLTDSRAVLAAGEQDNFPLRDTRA